MSKRDNYVFRYLDSEEFTLWDDFNKECENGTIFQSTSHLKCFAQALNLNFTVLAIFNNDNFIVAGMAFLYNTKLGIKYIYNPALTPFYSPVFKASVKKYLSKSESYNMSMITLIIEELSKEYKILNFALPVNQPDIRPYKWLGFHHEVMYTYKIKFEKNLSNIDYESDIKRRIKNAQELNFEIKSGVEKKQIDDYYLLQKKTDKRQNISFVFNPEQFENYINEMSKTGSAIIYIIYNDNLPVSGVVVLIEQETAYYLLAATDSDYFSTGLNQTLFDHIVKDLYKKGILYYDLVGANTPTIARFKSTYNFPLVPYYVVSKNIGMIPDLLMKLKNR